MEIFNLKLTPEQLQIISAALVELPFKMAAPLIDEINKQLRQQQSESENDLPTPS
jgi:hypothetical protein